LARLLGGDALRELHLFGDGEQLLDAPAATLLANALRENSTLACLALDNVNFWSNPTAAELLLHAAAAYPSLRKLELDCNRVDDACRARAGRALGTLVAANAPSLEELNIDACVLRDAGLGPLVDALASNTHLLTLRCVRTGISEQFARERLLPAARANTSLRALVLIDDGVDGLDDDEYEPEEDIAVLEEIQDVVAARAAAG
jgi:hypothetical protein